MVNPLQQFDKAAEDIKKLKGRPSDADLLEIYGFFKQATVGDADPAGTYLSTFLNKTKNLLRLDMYNV